MRMGRGVVGALGGAAALFAFAVGAVSLTRIAGDFLGFPPGLEWTLTAAVDVAGIAGGVMWTGFTNRVRNIGRPMNIVCTAVSGVGVGLDHATHAAPGWAWTAFAVGMFLPALVSWILHSLAVMADQTETPTHGQDRDPASPTASHHEATPRPPSRSLPTCREEIAGALVATTGTPDRDPLPTGSTSRTEAAPLPHLDVAPLSARQRPDWVTDELLAAVMQSIRETEGGRKNYGVPSVQRDHLLPDGRRIGSHRATKLLQYVDELTEAAS